MAELETVKRYQLLQFRAIGIPYLQWLGCEDLKKTGEPVPAIDGYRRRIQEVADVRNFKDEVTPFLHLPEKHEDIDPQASSSVYGAAVYRPTSVYLLNAEWYKLREWWDAWEIVKDFADHVQGLR